MVVPSRVLDSSSVLQNKRLIRPTPLFAFSFDDGREDNYRVALPIMNTYGLVGTINVTTGYVDGTYTPDGWYSATTSITVAQLQAMHNLGWEIASHGDKHLNTLDDLNASITKLKAWGLTEDGEVSGFASPGSGLSYLNWKSRRSWYSNNSLIYARSAAMPGSAVLDAKNNIPYSPEHPYSNYYLTSSAVMRSNTVDEIKTLVNDAINRKRLCVLMMHSILNPDDAGYGKDNWYWDASKFAELCAWLAGAIEVVTVYEGVRRINGL